MRRSYPSQLNPSRKEDLKKGDLNQISSPQVTAWGHGSSETEINFFNSEKKNFNH